MDELTTRTSVLLFLFRPLGLSLPSGRKFGDMGRDSPYPFMISLSAEIPLDLR